MRRALPAFLLCISLPLAGAAQEGAREARPPVDPGAIRDALRATGPGGTSWASARAYAHFLKARQAQARGDHQRALEEMRLAVIYDEDDAELRVELAWLYARADALDRATAELERALRLDPRYARAHLLLGRIRASQHRRREAIAALEEAIRLAPEAVEPWLVLTRVHADFGAWADAERVGARFERVHPRSGAPWRLLAEAAWGRADRARAARYLRRAAERDPDDRDSRLRLARIARGTDDAEAAARYAEVLRLDPTDEEALLASGEIALRAGDAVSARAYFRQLLGTARDPAGAALQVAAAWRTARRPDDALATLDEALRSESGDPRLHFARGLVLAARGAHREALAAFAAVPEAAGPLHAAALAGVADALSLLGAHDQAFDAIRRAVGAIGPGDEMGGAVYPVVPDVFRRAGRSAEAIALLQPLVAAGAGPAVTIAIAEALQDLGRHDQAQALLAAELVQAPGDTGLLFALAAARERAEDVEGAVGLVKALLDADPDNATALNFVGYVWADRGMRLEEARRLLRRALELEPEDPHILDSLGWCEVKRGNFEEGARLLERARAGLPQDPVVLHHLAAAYAALGREAEAEGIWIQALAILERDPDPRVRTEIEAARARWAARRQAPAHAGGAQAR